MKRKDMKELRACCFFFSHTRRTHMCVCVCVLVRVGGGRDYMIMRWRMWSFPVSIGAIVAVPCELHRSRPRLVAVGRTRNTGVSMYSLLPVDMLAVVQDGEREGERERERERERKRESEGEQERDMLSLRASRVFILMGYGFSLF